MNSLNAEYGLIETSYALIEVDDALVRVFGDDALEWLNGQVTQDLRAWGDGEAKDMCLCKPTGQLLAIMHGLRRGDEFFLSMERATVISLLDRVEQMVIMEDVSAELTKLRCVSAQGPLAPSQMAAEVVIPHDRSGRGGVDFWVSTSTASTVSHEVSEIVRIENGVPAFGADWNEKTLPPELGPVFEAKHISYNKGCYTGQEVLMRIFSRGHTNRVLVGLKSDEPFEIGAAVLGGTITSACVSPRFGPIALAMIRAEQADGTVRLPFLGDR